MTLRVDKEFKELIPPLANEEWNQLEQNVLQDGCRDPIVIWKEAGVIVDGHNRYQICSKHNKTFKTIEKSFASRDDVREWIILNQFGRRNITTYARAELALKLEPIFAKKAKDSQKRKPKSVCQNSDKQKAVDTKKEVARIAGVSHDTIAKAKLIRDNADEETKKELRTSKDKSIHRVAKDIKEQKQQTARKAERTEAAKTTIACREVIVGDFRDQADNVANGSLSLIFTDPPYNRDSLYLFDNLAKFAFDKLCNGGSLLCYCGQIQLPSAVASLSKHLRYWWTIACVHSGGAGLIKEYGIRNQWKPVLWFVKGTRDDKNNIVNDVISGGREKDEHEWQQALSEAEYWIGELCPVDGIVCDTFLGGGTTAVAAKNLGRKWIGFEIDPGTAAKASRRISQ